LTADQTNSLGVSAISSYAGGNGGNVTIEIDGTNFSPNTTASLTLGGTQIADSTIDFVSASQLFATFPLTNAATVPTVRLTAKVTPLHAEVRNTALYFLPLSTSYTVNIRLSEYRWRHQPVVASGFHPRLHTQPVLHLCFPVLVRRLLRIAHRLGQRHMRRDLSRL
jgi:hypothetical protein